MRNQRDVCSNLLCGLCHLEKADSEETQCTQQCTLLWKRQETGGKNISHTAQVKFIARVGVGVFTHLLRLTHKNLNYVLNYFLAVHSRASMSSRL